jgi:ABC-2 type transport system permease protein
MHTLRVIGILWLRQLKRYVRSKPRMIGSLGQPILFLVAMGFGLGPVFQAAGQGNYLNFIAPGIIGMSILFTGVFSGIEVIWDRQFGFLKETLVAPVTRETIMIGRTLGGATVATLQGVIVFLITLVAGFRPEVWTMLPLAFIFMALIGLMFTAFGTAIACKLQDMQAFPLIMNFLVMPLFFLSGALFPLANLPGAMHIVTRLNPLSYGIDGLRAAFGTAHIFPMVMSGGVLLAVSVLFLLLGSWLFKKMEA